MRFTIAFTQAKMYAVSDLLCYLCILTNHKRVYLRHLRIRKNC